MRRAKYKLVSYRTWDGEKHIEIWSNDIRYFDRYLNKNNYRSVIYEGKKKIFSEL